MAKPIYRRPNITNQTFDEVFRSRKRTIDRSKKVIFPGGAKCSRIGNTFSFCGNAGDHIHVFYHRIPEHATVFRVFPKVYNDVKNNILYRFGHRNGGNRERGKMIRRGKKITLQTPKTRKNVTNKRRKRRKRERRRHRRNGFRINKQGNRLNGCPNKEGERKP